MYPMLAGVPSSTPSAASRSAAPAERAGRTTSSTSSTIAAPSRTASRSVCRLGEGVWWTTSRRGMAGFSSRTPPPATDGRSYHVYARSVDDSRTMRERMLAGDLYIADDPEIGEQSAAALDLVAAYNATSVRQGPLRRQLLEQLLDRKSVV